jgi:cleavage and polyadenylation specificity factor subunit 1
MTFKRLLMLQRVLTYCLPHAAGLNPKLWRQYSSRADLARAPARNFLDGPLLWRYLGLTGHSQRQFAESIGSSAERVLANLRHADASAGVM